MKYPLILILSGMFATAIIFLASIGDAGKGAAAVILGLHTCKCVREARKDGQWEWCLPAGVTFVAVLVVYS